MPLYLYMLIILALSGVTLMVTLWMFHTDSLKGHRVHEMRERKLKGPRLYKSALINSVVSTGMFFSFILGLEGFLFTRVATPWWVIGLQAAGILMVYDTFYYFTHRYAFHGKGYLKKVHSVHHIGKHPTVVDSLYIHPVETLVGVGLLLGVTLLFRLIFGPLSVYTFVAVFFVYTQLNLLVHCGLKLRIWPFRLIGMIAEKHDRHHDGMKAGNYANLSPLPDFVFGTLE